MLITVLGVIHDSGNAGTIRAAVCSLPTSELSLMRVSPRQITMWLNTRCSALMHTPVSHRLDDAAHGENPADIGLSSEAYGI